MNKPVKDGEQFTEEGIYTITAKNEYTNQQTVKKIYVGSDEILKAHAATGFSIEDITRQILLGATISTSGNLIPLANRLSSESLPPKTESDSFGTRETLTFILYFMALIPIIYVMMPLVILAFRGVILIVVLLVLNIIKIIKARKKKSL